MDDIKKQIRNIFMKVVNSNIILLIVFTIFAVLFSALLIYLQLSIFWQNEQNYKMVYSVGFWTPLIDALVVVPLVILMRKFYEKNLEEKIEEVVEKSNKLNERLESALLGSQDGIWDWDIVTNDVYLSPRWKEMIGYSDDEIPNEFSTWESRVHPDDLEDTMVGLQDNMNGKTEYFEGIHRMKHKDGHWVWILDRGKAFFDEDGKPIRMLGTHTDISASKELELKSAQRGKILDNSTNEIFIFDAHDFKFLYMNKGAQKNIGYSLEEMLEMTPLDIKPTVSLEEFTNILKPITKDAEESIHFSSIHQRKDSSRYYADAYLQHTNFEGHDAYVAFVLDVTIRKEAEKDLVHQAHHDALTGLPNRVLFNDRLQQAIKKAKRNESKVAVLFIDLDHFKEINDSLGHETGDEVLKEVTQKLEDTIRDEDTLARLGGDEFTVIIENLEQGQDASLLANKILKVLSQPINIEDNILYVSSSIGISLYPDDGGTSANLLKYADSAMYRAKDEGRNNFQFYSAEMTELAFERVVMETSLRAALEHEDFIVYYQPQVNGVNDEIVGMEALVRWKHSTMGLVSPAKFIPIAESTGLIVELDRFVMKTAMTQLAKWYEEGLSPGVLAMNLSVKQLQRKDFITLFESLIKETGCRAEWLELEVTEGQIMNDPEESIKILNQISDIGIELAVDDFGTGYSSLSYLKKLPISKLKIDQSFVRDLPDDEEDAAIAKAVIALGQSLNLRVIAEGVETKEQKNFLVANGCKNIQGYFYAKPMPADEMHSVLLKGLTS